MTEVYNTLNDILVELFNDIMTIEQKALISDTFNDITVNDMHIIEAIGLNDSKSMSIVANKLKITISTLTIAINSLVKKGYVNKVRSEEDRRVVLISLTDKGVQAFKHHRGFHDEMIHSTINGLDDVEKTVLVKALYSLSNYFREIQNQ